MIPSVEPSSITINDEQSSSLNNQTFNVRSTAPLTAESSQRIKHKQQPKIDLEEVDLSEVTDLFSQIRDQNLTILLKE